MNPYIEVRIFTEHDGVFAVKRELSAHIISEVSKPLDIPRPGADSFSAMLCTGNAEIVRIKKSRQELAEMISSAITRLLIDFMERKDTEMGYKKETKV